MNPNDAPFDDDAPQSGGIFNLSRDTLVLFASLGFLALAILLAVFSGGDREPIPVAQVTLVATRPVITAIAEPTVAPDAPAIAYPAPGFGDGLVSAAEPYPAPVDAETPTSAVPTFAPLRPTEPAPIIMTATPPDFAASQATAYPAPEQPTIAPPPTSMPVADTATPAAIAQAQTQPRPTRAPPAPTEVPLLRLRGTTYWRAAQSPILVSTDVHIMPGAALVIEPGVEVQIAPGVALFVEGKLYALGQPGRRVRFTSSTSQRWEGIYGRGGSEIVLEQVEMRGGGAGGTLLAGEGGSLVIKGSRIANNGG
ncbi:MAG TPA: hypothetical protein PKA05_01535, partial [Roseiflexaceae bacterium]|nr:hypothetical protein [Roseiflexaceae bacterium]